MTKKLSESEKLLYKQFFRLLLFFFLGIGLSDLASYLNGTFFLPPAQYLWQDKIQILTTAGDIIFGIALGIFYMRYKEYQQREKLN